jgi:rRNA processing
MGSDRSMPSNSRGKRKIRSHIDHQKFTLAVKKKDEAIKSHAKAKMLREYSKLCTKEGIESDRIHVGPKIKTAPSTNDETVRAPRAAKPNPFMREIAAAEAKRSQEVYDKDKTSRSTDIKEARDRRNNKSKQYKLTGKGQPLLKSKIHGLLDKLTAAK